MAVRAQLRRSGALALIVIDGILYLVKNGGILTAFDAETGEVVKAARITGALGPYSASPVSADGHIYFATEGGHVAVVEAGRDWSVAAINALDERMYATPALSGGNIYVRTEAALCIFGAPQWMPRNAWDSFLRLSPCCRRAWCFRL